MNSIQALELLRDHIRLRQLSLSTERTYLQWARRYIEFLRERPPLHAATSQMKITAFLTALAHRHTSASGQNQALNALLFFYKHALGADPGPIDALRVQQPEHTRQAPSAEDVRRLLATITDTPAHPVRLIVALLYGCGLRVNEALALRVKDVDFEQERLVVRQPKNRRDRIVALPRGLAKPLAEQIRRARGMWEEDHWHGIPVVMPPGPRRTAARSPMSWPWFWVFPGARPARDPRSGRLVRWRCHEAVVQKAMARATADDFDFPLTPHHLRHAYATHALDRGANIRALQLAMGHKSLETTQRYLRSDALDVQSPFDALHGF
jgi:site-specific recombinase XerD